jgi:general secretion pathway protein I
LRRRRKTLRIAKARGFTLLEVMIAMAILSGALTWLVVGVSRNIKAENHAKLMTTATFLARQRMIDLEDELREKGFGEFEKEQNGNFEEKGFSRFTWRAIVDKVELPSQEQMQTVLTNARQAQQTVQGSQTGTPTGPLGGLFGGGTSADGSGASGGNPLSASAGALGSEFGIIKDVLEQAIRRVTIKIGWVEGRTPQEVELVAYYTDVRRVDQAIQLAQPPPNGGAGGGGTGGGGAAGSGGGH